MRNNPKAPKDPIKGEDRAVLYGVIAVAFAVITPISLAINHSGENDSKKIEADKIKASVCSNLTTVEDIATCRLFNAHVEQCENLYPEGATRCLEDIDLSKIKTGQ